MTRKAGGPDVDRAGLPQKPSLTEEDPRFYESLGRAIRVARTQQDLSRKSLAERAGVSYAYLSDIETGRGRPSSKALLAVAGALGRTPAELLQEAELYGAIQDLSSRPVPPSAAAPSPAPERSWFHAGSAPAVGGPEGRAVAGSYSRVARTELQRLARSRLAGGTASDRDELHAAIEGLSDEDVRIVLDLSRRLLTR